MAMRALLLGAAAPVAAAAAASCTGPSSCSLNGDCAADGQSCVCDAGWTGELCSALKQGQSTRVWPPAGTAGQDPAHLSASWGAGLVPPVKGVSEKWHLYMYMQVLAVGAALDCTLQARSQATTYQSIAEQQSRAAQQQSRAAGNEIKWSKCRRNRNNRSDPDRAHYY